MKNQILNRMNTGIQRTDFNLPGQIKRYSGKVRDVYYLQNNRLVVVATDRISAFDVILPRCIPGKGAILNEIAATMLESVRDIVPVWLDQTLSPGVSMGFACEPIQLEIVVRGYLVGHAARQYAKGQRELCGVHLPDGLQEHHPFPQPIITPTTKAVEGHDEDISIAQAVNQGIITNEEATELSRIALALFERGTELASKRGLILVDTKYEFGRTPDGSIMLIDEIHTPDSSRYFEAIDYHDRMERGERPRQLSKEFVREWLISEGFQGREGEKVPEMNDEKVLEIQGRYAELYTRITGNPFLSPPTVNLEELEELLKATIAQ